MSTPIEAVNSSVDRILSRHGLPGKVRHVSGKPNLATSSSDGTVDIGPLDCQSCVTDWTRWVDGQSRSFRVGLVSLPPGTDFSGAGWQLRESGSWIKVTAIKAAGNGYICDLEGGGL